jgi:hypothetical protein
MDNKIVEKQLLPVEVFKASTGNFFIMHFSEECVMIATARRREGGYSEKILMESCNSNGSGILGKGIRKSNCFFHISWKFLQEF